MDWVKVYAMLKNLYGTNGPGGSGSTGGSGAGCECEAATSEEIIDMLLDVEMMPVIQDTDGAILTDSDGAIVFV